MATFNNCRMVKRHILRYCKHYFNSIGEQANQNVPSVDKRIATSICVQRFPIISKTKTSLEQQFDDLQAERRLESSKLSDFELEEKQYLENKKAREKKAMEEDVDISRYDSGTAFEELMEAREIELKMFKPQSRTTEADLSNDRQSLNRKLDSILYLLVKNPQEYDSWIMPQGTVIEGKAISESAEIELTKQCGSELTVQLLSNAPVAYYQYKYRTTLTKLFFIKAQYLSGNVVVNTDLLQDYVWLTKDELKDYLSINYYNAIAPTLFD